MPLRKTWPARPWGLLCFCSAQDPAPSWRRGAGHPALGVRAAAQLFLGQLTTVFDSSAPGQGTLVGTGACVVLDFKPLVLLAMPLPRATHPPVPGASVSVSRGPCCAGVDSLLLPQSKAQLCTCRLPSCPASRLPEWKPLTAYILGRQRTSLSLVVPQHQFVTHFTRRWPSASPLYGTFLSPGAPAGLWPDAAATCFGSCLGCYAPGCQRASQLPSLFGAEVFSFVGVFFLWDLCRLLLFSSRGFYIPSQRPISSHSQEILGLLLVFSKISIYLRQSR